MREDVAKQPRWRGPASPTAHYGKISYLHGMLLLVVACFLLGIVFQVVYASLHMTSVSSSSGGATRMTNNLYNGHKAAASLQSEVSLLKEEERQYSEPVRETRGQLASSAIMTSNKNNNEKRLQQQQMEPNPSLRIRRGTTPPPIAEAVVAAPTITVDTLSSGSSSIGSGLGVDTALLIIASNRPQYLRQCLQKVVANYPYSIGFPVVVSEDGSSKGVEEVVSTAREDFLRRFSSLSSSGVQQEDPPPFVHIHHPPGGADGLEGPRSNGYFKLAYHFKWAIDNIFALKNNNYEYSKVVTNIKRVIILEEDLLIANDFFDYFGAVAPMLHSDPSLIAASAFNDNGFEKNVKDPEKLYRSDFFPGLGWMCTREIWEELSAQWPKAYWDDWLREPKHRKGRNFIRPEISRTFHIGTIGVSNSQFGNYLETVKLNEKHVKFSDLDLSYLSKQRWDLEYLGAVYSGSLVATTNSFDEVVRGAAAGREVTLFYDRLEGQGSSFVSLAAWAGCMDNIKAGVPRTAYKGVVSIWRDGTKVHLAPRNRM